jgi:hypothetical protein
MTRAACRISALLMSIRRTQADVGDDSFGEDPAINCLTCGVTHHP